MPFGAERTNLRQLSQELSRVFPNSSRRIDLSFLLKPFVLSGTNERAARNTLASAFLVYCTMLKSRGGGGGGRHCIYRFSSDMLTIKTRRHQVERRPPSIMKKTTYKISTIRTRARNDESLLYRQLNTYRLFK